MRSESKTNGCRSDDCYTLRICCLDDLPGVGFRDSFSNDGNGANLKAFEQKGLTFHFPSCYVTCRWYVMRAHSPVGTAWSPWCYQRPNAEMQSWWARPHRGASSWRHSCSYTQGRGSLYGPSRTSVCGLHCKAFIHYTVKRLHLLRRFILH